MFKKISAGLNWLQSPYEYLDRFLERGELTFRLNLPVIGKSVITGEPACIAEIVRNGNLIGGRGTQALRPVVGNHSLIVLEGAAHEHQRKLMLPHFFSGDLSKYDSLTRKWVLSALDTLPMNTPFSGMKFTAEITLNIIIEILFGPLPAQSHSHATSLVGKWLNSFRNPAVLFLKPLQVNLGSHSPWGRFLANRKALHRFIQELIDTNSEQGVLGSILEKRHSGDLQASDEEIISQIITFLMFGHDTSAAAMGWFFQHAWSDADALTDIREEILKWSSRDEVSMRDPEEMALLKSAIQESMRLTPVVVHLTRHAIAPTNVGNIPVAKGERVLPCMYLAHRNEKVFENPEHFMAKRFIDPRPEWRHAYFPFGLGNRLCAGMPFALRQMLLILSELVLNATFELVSSEKTVPVRNMVLIVPSGGPEMRRIS